MHGQQVHEALAQALEEDCVVDDLRAVGALRLAARIVQEHEIEVRPVTRARARRACRTPRRSCARRCERPVRIDVARHAVTGGDLRPREHQRFAHDQLGDVGEAIADLHQRQPPR